MNIVSFGGGTNSTAMIIGMYLHKIPIDLILFADTGGEQPHTYKFIEIFNGWLEKHGLPQIISVQYHDKDGNRLTLEQECISSGRLPSIAYGYKKCSLKHKIGTQEKFCNNYQPCKDVWASGQRVHKFIGYDAGETRRIQHAAPIDEADKKYEKHYPLYVWGWTREECVRVIERAGLPRPGKSSCFFCPSMKKKEIQALWEKYPDLFRRAVALEHGSAATNTSVKGLGRNWSWEHYGNRVHSAEYPQVSDTERFLSEQSQKHRPCPVCCSGHKGADGKFNPDHRAIPLFQIFIGFGAKRMRGFDMLNGKGR